MPKFKVTYDDGTSEIIEQAEAPKVDAPVDEESEAQVNLIAGAPGSERQARGVGALASRYGLPAMAGGIPGAVGLGAGGSALAALFEGRTPGALETIAGGVGGGAGALLGKGLGIAARYRPPGVGQAGDVQRIASAVGKEAPELAPQATEESMQALLRGPAGKQRLSQEFSTEAKRIQARVPADLGPLFQELREAGGAGYRAGAARETAAGAAARRSRTDILKDIQTQLQAHDPTGQLVEAFNQMQSKYATGSAVRRLFAPERVLGTRGLNQGELQAQMVKRSPQLSQELSPEFTQAVFRGGAPPKADLGLTATPWGLPLSFGTVKNRAAKYPPEIARLVQALLQSGGAGGPSAMLGP